MPGVFAQDVPLNELVNRVLERSELIQSGKFRTSLYGAADKDIIIAENADLDSLEMKYTVSRFFDKTGLVFRGKEWALSSFRNSYEIPYNIFGENYMGEHSTANHPNGEVERTYRVTPKTSDLSDFFRWHMPT
jgi:hypothetical protein